MAGDEKAGPAPGRSRWSPRLPLLVAGALAAAAFLFSLFGDMGIVGTVKLYRTQKQVLEENVRLREENARLQQEVRKLRTNPAYIEEIARKELGLIREKENVIVLDRKKEPAPPAPSKSGAGAP